MQKMASRYFVFIFLKKSHRGMFRWWFVLYSVMMARSSGSDLVSV